MNNLTIINQNGKLVTDSREVADMVDKQHKDLLASIRSYNEHLLSGHFRPEDFFIPSTYQDSTGRTLPCYLLTKKGCDMVANKMTGEKGVLFTATYVTKFEEMEKSLKPTCIEDVLIQSLQEMKDMRQQLNEVNNNALVAKSEAIGAKEEVQAIRDTISINPRAEWRKQTNIILSKIGKALSNYKLPKDEAYNALKERGNCRPNILVNNLKARALMQGMSKSKVDDLNILDVLENEQRLKEIYVTIVKEMAIKHNV